MMQRQVQCRVIVLRQAAQPKAGRQHTLYQATTWEPGNTDYCSYYASSTTTTYTQPTINLAEKRKDNLKNRGAEGRQIETEKEGRQQIIGQEHHLHLLDYFMCLIENLSRKVTDIKCPAKVSGPSFFNTKIYQKSKFFALPAG